jgi:PKD repeat protein
MKQFYPQKLIFIVLLLLLGTLSSEASHIAGGEITYECLGGNQYRVRYVFFRDCGGAALPTSTRIDIYDASNNLVQQPNLPLDTSIRYIGEAPTPCTLIPNGVCLDIGEYEAIVTLPPIPGGYTLAYESCCRNGGIVNGSAGSAAYFATIPDASLASCNNRAIFRDWPPTFICRGDTFNFDHSATDIDGDSLVYTLCTPYESIVPSTPYLFGPGFSASNPMGGANPLVIDPVTGMMTAVPPNVGKYVIGVCVSEYRNGNLITSSSRDLQLNVVNCQEITVASAISAATNCSTREVSFFNNSTGASTYDWDFGDGTTSTATNPVHNYPAYGTYNVTLIGYNSNPQCNDTTTAIIALVDTCRPCGMNVQVTTIDGVCNPIDGCAEVTWVHPCGSSQSISYGGSSSSGGCGSSNSFSGGGAPLFSNITAVVDGVTLPSPLTTETVTITGPANPCGGSLSISSSGGNIIYQFNTVYTQPQSGGAYVTITGGTAPYNVQWVTSPGQTGDTAYAIAPGNYNVIVTDANGCVEVVPFLVGGASNMTLAATGTDVSACGANDGTLNVLVAGNTGTLSYLWSPGAYTTASVSNVPPGFYTVLVTDDSCSTTDTVRVRDAANVQLTINVSDIICPIDSNGAASVVTTTGGAGPYSYSWNTNPVETGPSVSNLPFGFYTVVAQDQNGCRGQQSFSITGPVRMQTTISGTDATCANISDGTATIATTGGTAPYNVDWNAFPPQNGPNATSLPGRSTFYTATVTDDNGCIIKDSIAIKAPLSIQIDLEDLSSITCAGVFTGSAGATITGGQPNLVDATPIYTEPFDMDDLEIDCDRWFTDVSAGGTNTILHPSDYFRVINNQFAGQDLDGEGVWKSRTIDIFAETNVTISGDFFECGNMEATDYIRAYYSINGGPEINWFDLTDDGATDCVVNSPSLAGLSGGSIQIIIRMLNNSSEIHRFDNINVTGNNNGVLYNEPFNTNDLWNDPNCEWQRDVSAVTTTNISGAGTAEHAETRNGVFEFMDVDGEIVWSSTLIDISSCATVNLSVDFNYGGFMSSTEYIRGYYSVDGGPEVLWADHTDDTPAAWPSNPFTDVISGLSGNTVQIIVRALNTGSTDFHSIDNILVNCHSPSDNPYDLAWSCTAATTDTVIGVPTGICTMTATDSVGCAESSDIAIVNPGTITSSARATDACGGVDNGTATATPLGGDAPYSYLWSCSGATTQAVSGLVAGTNCTVTVTDNNACTVSSNVVVGTSPDFSLDTVVTLGDCINTASIDLSVTGGTAAFVYSWSNGETTEDVSGILGNTTIRVSVFDANLCFKDLEMFIDSVGCILLPINLLSFEGQNSGQFNELYWQTELEINKDYFTVEKSQNGANWTYLGKVNSLGNTIQNTNYTLVDETPFETTYYRLKIVDLDGSFSYSNVIVVRKMNHEDTKVRIYPNPTDDKINLQFPVGYWSENPLEIILYNTLGEIVLSKVVPISKQKNTFVLEMNKMVDGIYLLTVHQGEKQFTEKIIVRH